MGAKQHTYATIRQALDLIADRRLATATNVAKPDQYRARILDDLRATRHDEALAILEEHPGTDPEILARLLDPPAPKGDPEPPNPSSALTEWDGPDIEPADGPVIDDPDEAKARLAAIRDGLGPAHHPARTSTSMPATWGDPRRPDNAERISQWVWCPVVWAVLTDDPCAFDHEHPKDCECGSRFPLTVATNGGNP